MPKRLLPVLALLAFGCADDPDRGDAAASADAARRGAKVWICHATASETNPYNLIHVSSNAWDGRGRNDHTMHVGDYEASGPDEECGYDSGDDGGGDDGGTGGDDGGGDGGGTGGDDGGGTGGDDGGGTGGDDGGGDDGGGTTGGDSGGEPPVCFTLGNEADCTAEPTCTWDGAVCLPAGFEI